MVNTIETNEVKTKQQIWKSELDELKKEKTNKNLPSSVRKLIDEQITNLEERVSRYDEFKGLLFQTNNQIDRLNKKLADLKREQGEFQEFLGINAAPKLKHTLNVEDVTAFIKKNGNAVTYGQLSNFTGLGRVKIKNLLEKNPTFKIDATVFPQKVSVK